MTDAKSDKLTNRGPSFCPTYLALLLAGLILLADSFAIMHLNRWTTKAGIALVFSAIVLLVGRTSFPSGLAVVIIWVAVTATFVF